MNEKVIKAILYFKNSFEKTTPPFWYDYTIANNEEQIKLLINLIDEQQQEISGLKYKVKNLIYENMEMAKKRPDLHLHKYIELPEIEPQEYISKNKIKELLHKYEWSIKHYDCDQADYKQSQCVGAWNVLTKLLNGGDE